MPKASMPLIARARAYHRATPGHFWFRVDEPEGTFWESQPADPWGTVMLIRSLTDGPGDPENATPAERRALKVFKLTLDDALSAVSLLMKNPDPVPPGTPDAGGPDSPAGE